MPTPKILVVDDETQVLNYMAAILRRHGYEVHQANDAHTALQTAEKLSCGLNLVITDVAMPEVSGDELVRQIRQKCPYVDVLLVTGALNEEELRVENCPVLKKPFLPTSLTKVVTEILANQIY